MDSGGIMSIEKLDGTNNFSTWRFQMELILIHENLWEYISKTPEVTDVAGQKLDQRARAKICLSLKPHCLVHVRSCKNTKEVWSAIQAAFEDKGLNNRCKLLSKLMSLKLEQFTTVREYVTSAMSISQELSDIGKEIDDELLAALLLQGLTQEFQPMKLAIENSNIILTTDYVKNKLFQMEDTYSNGSSKNTTALLTNKQKGKYTAKKKAKTKIKCFICDGPHKAQVCPKNPSKNQEAFNTYALATAREVNDEEWVFDSGASGHMTRNKDWFQSFQDFSMNARVQVTCADGNRVLGVGKGKVECKSLGLTVSDVMYVPELQTNLMSVSAVVNKGHVAVFRETGCEIYKKGEVVVRGKPAVKGVQEKGVFKLKKYSQNTALSTTVSQEAIVWHQRMGHLGMRNLLLLRDKLATGVSFPNTTSKLNCVACVMGKQTRQPFPKKGGTRAKEPLELVHSDVCGPMENESFGGCRYFLTFIDDFTRKTYVYFLKQKGEVFGKFKEFKALAENQSGKKVRAIRTDNGKEFVNKQMDEYLRQHGIQHQLSVEYTPEQNGVAERANRTICEKARCMLQEARLEKKFWAEAVRHAVFLKNRSPTIAVKNKTPEEAWTGRKSDLKIIKIFGCKAFMHVPNQKRSKWDAKSRELVHTGYCDDSKAYRLVDYKSGQCFKAKDVVFFEHQIFSDTSETSDEVVVPLAEQPKEVAISEVHNQKDRAELNNYVPLSEMLQNPGVDTETINFPVQEAFEQPYETGDSHLDEPVLSDGTEADEYASAEEDEDQGRRYPLRNRKPKDYQDYILYQAETEQDPTTIQEALSRPDSREWRTAIQEELDALKKNKTWVLVKPGQASNVVDSKWLFRIKEEAGNKRRYKARLVARGFSQRYGIDYDETFAPVVRHSSLRVLLAMAVKSGLKIDQMDVKTAFLNGDLTETVYMRQPDGYEEKGKEDYVCLLKRSLYGLKQSPRAWNNKLNNELLQLSFKRSKNEPCIYTRSQGKKIIILAVYVDDMLIFWNDAEELRKVKKDLMSKFEMKDLGTAECILGMHITQNDIGIKVDQEKYVEKLLKVFGMTDCKVASTPSVPGQKLVKHGLEHKPDPRIPYQNLIGSLMYISVCTRPDIAHTVNYLSQFNTCYAEEHWISAKRVLRYLKGTKSLGLQYTKTKIDKIQGYADASHATCYDRRSYSGMVFLLMGAAICWESRKQKTVALSTAEAEYVAMSEATREAIFLKRLISEVTGQVEEPMKIFSDSQSAVAIAQNPVHHQRTKHIDVRHHFVREAVENGHIELEYVETARMVADVLTKPLLKGMFKWCTLNMGVV